MAESWRTRLTRWGFNWFPAYRGTGARLTYIAHDWREIRVRLPLSWRTRNYVGTIFGGSLYGALDPIYMVMLLKVLGPDYVVWDKAATIRFRRPGRTTLFATFQLTDEDLAAIQSAVAAQGRTEWRKTVVLTDAAGTIHVECDKVLSIRRRAEEPPGERRSANSGVLAQRGSARDESEKQSETDLDGKQD